jgi:predicted Zn-dependent protease
MSLWRSTLRQVRWAGLAAALMALAACSSFMGPGVNVTRTGANPAPFVTGGNDTEDAVIGLREHPKIIASYGGVYEDRDAEVLLAQIVGRLLTAANQPNTNFTVTILNSSEVNAFALPGGYIYVTRGILALASDSSELAAVLAHEMAHVILKHARARSNREHTSEIVNRVITNVFGADVETDQDANRQQVDLAAFSQQQELEADRTGIMIAGKAGYDPHAAARFLTAMGHFAEFSSGEASQADDFLSSHPSTPDRIAKATEAARTYFGAPGIGTTDRDRYLTSIDGLLFGDTPDNGAIAGRRFIQPSAKFTFTVPEGYTLQNSKSAVVGVAGDGEAVRFDSAEVPATTPLTDYLKSGWIAGLRPETVKAVNARGMDMATGIAATAQWNFRVSVVRYGGKVYRFIFAARFDSDRFAKGAEDTLRSFRATTSKDIAMIRQIAIRIVTARPGDTADTLAREMSGLTRGRELFYILNNLEPGDPVTPGTKYKIVVAK